MAEESDFAGAGGRAGSGAFVALQRGGIWRSGRYGEEMILQTHPDYEPWFQPILEPASGEIESLLFALQAAAGAGVLGFALGRLTARAPEERK